MNRKVDYGVCSNCKNKIDPGNVFCSYCGNIIPSNVDVKEDISHDNNINAEGIDMSKQGDTIKDNQIHNKENVNKIKGDGIVYSIFSLILFVIFFVPYIIGSLFVNPLGFVLIIYVIWPSIASFVLGMIALTRYEKSNKEKTKFREILNLLNNISLITMIIFAIIVVIFIIWMWFA